MRLQKKQYKEEKEKMTQEDELVEIKYTYARLQTIKRKYPKIFEELKDKTGKNIDLVK